MSLDDNAKATPPPEGDAPPADGKTARIPPVVDNPSIRLFVSFLLTMLVAGFIVVGRLPYSYLWIACALIALRFACHEREDRAGLILAVATGFLLWLGALLAVQPLAAIALGAAPLFGAGIAWKRRLAAVPVETLPGIVTGGVSVAEAAAGVDPSRRPSDGGSPLAVISANPATALYRGVSLHTAALLTLVLLTPVFLAAAGHEDRGYLDGEMQPIWDATVAETRRFFDTMVAMRPESDRAQFEEFTRELYSAMDAEDASYLVVNHLLFTTLLTGILALGVPMRRRFGYELGSYKASEREMLVVIVALAFHLLASRVGEGELVILARPIWWSVASLLWLQAIALAVFVWEMGRRTGQKLLYFMSAATVVLFVCGMVGFIIGLAIGLADVYLDIRKTSTRLGASGTAS